MLYACMCVCMYVYMFVCMYVCMYTCLYVCLYLCMFIYTYKHEILTLFSCITPANNAYMHTYTVVDKKIDTFRLSMTHTYSHTFIVMFRKKESYNVIE